MNKESLAASTGFYFLLQKVLSPNLFGFAAFATAIPKSYCFVLSWLRIRIGKYS